MESRQTGTESRQTGTESRQTGTESAASRIAAERQAVAAGIAVSKQTASAMEIVRVGKILAEKGLLVRTWGNLSARIDEHTMLITPSGLPFRHLTPEKIVRMDIETLRFEGAHAPSNDAMVHAALYRGNPEIQFVVHTHQTYATCAGSLDVKDVRFSHGGKERRIAVAPYATPGSDRLAQNVAEIRSRFPRAKGMIMESHGALTYGTSADEAVLQAERMEILCYNYLIDICNTELRYGIREGYSSSLENGRICFAVKDTPERVRRIHRQIYGKRPDVRYILHNLSEAEKIVSRRCVRIKPMLYDFAQIVGTGIRIPANENARGRETLWIRPRVNAVFVPDDGAYCLGENRSEAEAVALILSKGCIGQIAAMRTGRGHFLSFSECRKMNRHYHTSYAQLSHICI